VIDDSDIEFKEGGMKESDFALISTEHKIAFTKKDGTVVFEGGYWMKEATYGDYLLTPVSTKGVPLTTNKRTLELTLLHLPEEMEL